MKFLVDHCGGSRQSEVTNLYDYEETSEDWDDPVNPLLRG